MAELTLHEDRLLPAEPGQRAIARRIYRDVRDLPIISPHGHVPAQLLLDDRPFADPTSLLITPDHYVTRLLHASGVPLAALGVGVQSPHPDLSRSAWRTLCSSWPVFRGTPVRYWLETQLVDVFGVGVQPSAQSADLLYDEISARLAEQAFRPRALATRFGIDVLATTDDPCADLSAHAALAADSTWQPRVVPTFRPDRYLDPAQPGWVAATDLLGACTGVDTGSYGGFLTALADRRRYFRSHGATATDHGHPDAGTEPLAHGEATRIYARARQRTASADELTAFRRSMIFEMARMSCEDGLVMTLHPGICRGHHTATAAEYGPDTGHDIPVQVEFTRALRPLLEQFGTEPSFRLVLFTTDESVYSRELAPLAGFYPSVYLGAPWWFLDAPDAVRRFRAAVTETAGFSRTAGFVDDTRAFCSIPARHDMSRRLDAGYLAGLVSEHRLTEDEAVDVAVGLVIDQPRKAFGL